MNTKLDRSDWIILFIIFGTSTVLNSIDYYREGNALIEYLIDFPSSILFSIILILIFVHVLVPKFLIERKRFISFFIVSILLLTVFGTLSNLMGRLSAGKSLEGISNWLLYLQNGLYNAADMIGVPLGILLIKKFYEGQSLLVQSEKQQKENELKLLRSQINPHFLFNNLNTLDSLIDSDSEKAKEYINRLSLTYRYLIQTKDSEVMELSEELQHAENYIYLIKTRFGNDYEFLIDKKASIHDKFIPTGSIQALLENVVKHNKAISNGNIKAAIVIENDWLTIRNTKSTAPSQSESLGTGLNNLKSRYQLLSDQKVTVTDSKEFFEVIIPIIRLSE